MPIASPNQPLPPPRPARLHYGLVVLGLSTLAVFSSLGLARFGYSMLLPAMQAQLGLSHLQTGQLQSWNLFGYMITVAVTGVLASHLGPRRVIAAALLLVAVGMAVSGWADSFAGVAAGRFLAGVGGAAANVPAMALLAAWFAPRRRGLAAGIGVTGSSLGLMFTGALVPAILEGHGEEVGWRLCWWVFAGLALVASALCASGLRNRPQEMGLVAVGQTDGDPLRPGLPGAPSHWHDVCRSGFFWHLAGVYFVFGFAYIVYSTFFVKHVVRVAGLSTAEAGRLWLQIGLLSTISGFLWGAISDRLGRYATIACIFALQGVSFSLLGLAEQRTGILLSAGLFALTAWSIPAIVAAIAGDRFGPRLAPAALGLATVVFGFGQVLGPWLGGAIADATGNHGPAFLLAGGMALLPGTVGAALLRRWPSVGDDDQHKADR